MEFFSFIVLVLIAVILWRINNQIPDLIFRLSEIQRDIAFFKKEFELSYNNYITAHYWAEKSKYGFQQEFNDYIIGDLFYSMARSWFLHREGFDRISCGSFRAAYKLGNAGAKKDQVFPDKCGLPEIKSTSK